MKHYYFIQEKNYTYIYNISIDEFLEYNTPCKECLIQPICMSMHRIQLIGYSPKLTIKACEKLNTFITREKCFDKLY